MGTNGRWAGDLDCGEDHGYGSCPKDHVVSARWARTSDICTIQVDAETIVMTVALFDALRSAMLEVRE